MGLPHSMENILSWRSQYDRMERWYGRLIEQLSIPRSDYGDQDAEALDLFNCYALRDWFVKSGAFKQSELDAIISENLSMQMCRDICNRSKHLEITRASLDPRFSILREYRGACARNALIFLADRSTMELEEVSHSCIEFWRVIIRDHKPPEPRNPFHP